MGVAALEGVARSQTSTLTPFGGRPCIFATLRIERDVDRGSREQHWKIVANVRIRQRRPLHSTKAASVFARRRHLLVADGRLA